MVKDIYTTTNLHLAAYCMLRGAQVADIKQGEGRKAVVILDNEGDRAFQASREFYSYELMVPLHQFLRARAVLIERIRQMRAETEVTA